MKEFTIEYVTASGEKGEWLAIALNRRAAFTDFLMWCVEEDVDPRTMGIFEEPL